MGRYRKYWSRRIRLSKAHSFSMSNIFAYLGLMILGGSFPLSVVFSKRFLNNPTDIAIILISMCILIVLSGLATIREKRTVDGIHLQVIRGKQAVRTGTEMAIFGIFMALLVLFGMR